MKQTKTQLWLSRDWFHNYSLWNKKPRLYKDGEFKSGTIKSDTRGSTLLQELCPRDVHKIFGVKLENKKSILVELTVTIKKPF